MSTIQFGSTQQPLRPTNRGAVLRRATFSDAQLETAGNVTSAEHGMATKYDFCGTLQFCRTIESDCNRVRLEL